MANNPLISLKRRSEFISLKQEGQRLYPCDWIVVNYKTKSLCVFRFGWTAPKYVGNAVVRNRLKKWCRVYFKNKKPVFKDNKGADINIIFTKKRDKIFYKNMTYAELKSKLDKAVLRIEKNV